jgi:hypothetical protein
MERMACDWQKLAQIEELQDYFEADFEGFQGQIQGQLQDLQTIAAAELDKLASLRVLEITNGCTQWGFRRRDEQCLSAEQTRACMQKVIGFIRNKKIELPSGTTLTFTPQIERLIEAGRDLYQQAFKRNVATAQRDYYAYSTAQFIVYGLERLTMALDLIQQEFEPLFTPYYIARGRRYILPYMNALTATAPQTL